ncbi:MAG: SdpI family protein [Clostridia bacterium]|nr:SdpI family protein [Clostridia bacterium]
MMKNNRKLLIVTSLVILLPMIFGILMWDKLPHRVPAHFNFEGETTRLGDRGELVFLLPLSLLPAHWLCLFITSRDPGNRDQTKKAVKIVYWIMPVISVVISAVMYAIVFDIEFGMDRIMPFGFGLMFAVMGNYLPKIKQNYTLGIKLTWTVNNEDNWNATHRFGGKVWVIGGILMIISGLIPGAAGIGAFMIVVFAAAFIPMIYSYLYYRKQKEKGEYFETKPPLSKGMKLFRNTVLIGVGIMLIGIVYMMFTGSVEIVMDEESFTVEASYWDDVTVEYNEIEAIEYREELDPGYRASGFGSPVLLMGTFENDEFGYYIRYSYTKCNAAVIIECGDDILVIGGETAEQTREIYEAIAEKIR